MKGDRRLLADGALALAAAFLIFATLGLKPYGIFILSMRAVMTIAAIGLNLTIGYAGQISLAQAAFVGIGAYITAWLMTKGAWPFWRACPALMSWRATPTSSAGWSRRANSSMRSAITMALR